MSNAKKIRNIGILAHVDAGKTTLTENFLYLGQAIKEKGSVDKGTSQTDYYDIEKERGISIAASSAYFTWDGHTVNIIDTTNNRNTLMSKSLRFRYKTKTEPKRIAEITYSLVVLNVVSPTPSIKQTGKFCQ